MMNRDFLLSLSCWENVSKVFQCKNSVKLGALSTSYCQESKILFHRCIMSLCKDAFMRLQVFTDEEVKILEKQIYSICKRQLHQVYTVERISWSKTIDNFICKVYLCTVPKIIPCCTIYTAAFICICLHFELISVHVVGAWFLSVGWIGCSTEQCNLFKTVVFSAGACYGF